MVESECASSVFTIYLNYFSSLNVVVCYILPNKGINQSSIQTASFCTSSASYVVVVMYAFLALFHLVLCIMRFNLISFPQSNLSQSFEQLDVEGD